MYILVDNLSNEPNVGKIEKNGILCEKGFISKSIFMAETWIKRAPFSEACGHILFHSSPRGEVHVVKNILFSLFELIKIAYRAEYLFQIIFTLYMVLCERVHFDVHTCSKFHHTLWVLVERRLKMIRIIN